MDKTELRDKARAILKGLTEDEITNKSVVISKQLKSLLQQIYSNSIHSHGYLGAYAPIQQEVIWYSSFNEDDYQLAVPHLENEILMDYYPTKFEDLAKNKLGLKLSDHMLSQAVKPEVILIPGLAFTISGKRLGRGKGYFDRYLSKIDGVKIGVAFECQVLKDIETDKYDIGMDYLITETNIYKC